MASDLRYSAPNSKKRRIVLLLEEEQLDRVDRWGVPAGKSNRTEALRELITRGLDVVASRNIEGRA